MRILKRVIGAVLVVAVLAVGALLLLGGFKGEGRNSVTIRIEAPVPMVYAWITEPEKLKQWMGGLVESTPLTTEGLKVGARSREVFQMGDEKRVMEVEITALRPNERLEAKVTSDGFAVDVKYILSQKDGLTRVTYIGDAKYHKLHLRLFEPVITPMAQQKLEEDFARLKELIEASKTTAGGEPT